MEDIAFENPEEVELKAKRVELAQVKTLLADRELEVAILRNELQVFELTCPQELYQSLC